MTIQLYELVGADTKRPFSPHCWKAAMALRHKGLTFESVPTSFTKVPLVEGGVGKTVPVLRDGDRVVVDSFQIALYLEENYPDRPTLFGGKGGEAIARFVEKWCLSQLMSLLVTTAVVDIHDMLAPEDQVYFRQSREARYGKALEEVVAGAIALDEELPKRLMPLTLMLKDQPFIGGEAPLFADYIVFGALQWMRICLPQKILEPGSEVSDWFERCLDLDDGFARQVTAAA